VSGARSPIDEGRLDRRAWIEIVSENMRLSPRLPATPRSVDGRIGLGRLNHTNVVDILTKGAHYGEVKQLRTGATP
jgi:hypothetical protein